MSTGGGEAADQMVRMMLSGTEVAVRLSGSAVKNLLALSLALAKQNKSISGKVNLGKMLRETRDLRQFPMTPEQYAQFHKLARKQKILYSAIHDKDGHGKQIDVILPVTELDRANALFPKIGLIQTASIPEQQEGRPSKKDSRSERASPDTRTRSSTSRDTRTTSERPSVEGRLKAYRAQLDRQKEAVPTKEKARSKPKAR